ncbi:MAG: A/G-specific adenine glycosylase [Rhodocyclaceae bacterium]|jgi:A/G-specific adenine glycosylase|nr:A/G-specific adenine glycosylase [Rhodocyclaceae bacterium]
MQAAPPPAILPDPTFAPRLLAWQATHGRHDLPWQGHQDPYPVWLSEIMLQQTQVDTVIPYYQRFLARFPDLASLAGAPVEAVMALWSGLGYYARARNLHRCAQVLMTQHGGRFPPSAQAIAELPGIGRSTAAAIAAFAFGERRAILDGNVKRVLCRVFGVEGFPGERAVENRLWALAEALLPETRVGAYIQAQMDLGATLCTRARPACPRCPLRASCVASQTGRQASLPTPRPRKTPPRKVSRVLVILRDGAVLLERRPPAGIWGGLLALPEIPAEADAVRWAATELGLAAHPAQALPALTHAFTHFVLEIRPELVEAREGGIRLAEGPQSWLALAELEGAALPTPVRRILEGLGVSGC